MSSDHAPGGPLAAAQTGVTSRWNLPASQQPCHPGRCGQPALLPAEYPGAPSTSGTAISRACRLAAGQAPAMPDTVRARVSSERLNAPGPDSGLCPNR